MKLGVCTFLTLAVAACAGCATGSKTSLKAETTPTAAPIPAAEAAPEAPADPPEKSGTELWAEKKSREEVVSPSTTPAMDPMTVDGAMESALIPNIELTPPKELRPKTRRDLEDGLRLAQKAETFEEATKKLSARLGKPNWTENGQRRVWIAKDGANCHRLILATDGSVETEIAPMTEWRMLSGLAQQNPCTGEVQRGVPGLKGR
jgi:hypothetical protein